VAGEDFCHVGIEGMSAQDRDQRSLRQVRAPVDEGLDKLCCQTENAFVLARPRAEREGLSAWVVRPIDSPLGVANGGLASSGKPVYGQSALCGASQPAVPRLRRCRRLAGIVAG